MVKDAVTEQCSCKPGEACDTCQGWEQAADYDPHEAEPTLGPIATYHEIVRDLDAKAANAARRGKPVMWAHYGGLADLLRTEFATVGLTDGGYAGAALAISQQAQLNCPTLPRARAARWWALGTYARRILAAWGAGSGGPVSLDWLRKRAAS